MEKKNVKKMIITTLSGIAGGAILGMLFAPDKGKKTREKISEKSDQYMKTVKDDVSELGKYMNNRAKKTKTEINELSQNAKRKGEAVLQKAKKLTSYEGWTTEELKEKARKQNIERSDEMNKEELIAALKEKKKSVSTT